MFAHRSGCKRFCHGSGCIHRAVIERISSARRGGRGHQRWQSDLAQRIRPARRNQAWRRRREHGFPAGVRYKTLTAAAAATVVDEGKLDWDKPIFNYVPEFVGYDPYMTRWLTERDLLAQRTGWPAYTGDQLDSFGYDRAEILLRLRFFKPRYSLREVAQYSNPGFFVAGEVAARCAKQSWNDLVEQRLFKPLQMSRSGTVIKALQDPNATAAQALVDGKIVVVEPSELDVTGAASSGTSTAADMSKLVLMFLNKGTYKDKRVLKP